MLRREEAFELCGEEGEEDDLLGFVDDFGSTPPRPQTHRARRKQSNKELYSPQSPDHRRPTHTRFHVRLTQLQIDDSIHPSPDPAVSASSTDQVSSASPQSPQLLQQLPPALQMEVIVHLRVRDVCGLALVCRDWAAWVRSDDFWRRLHAQRFDPSSTALPSPFTASFPSLSPPSSASPSSSSLLAPLPPQATTSSQAPRPHRPLSPRSPSPDSPSSPSKWREDFKIRHERARGWRRNNYREVVMRGHQAAVTTVRMWSAKDRVFSASADSTIRAWNTGNGKALGAIRGHTGSVMCLHRNETSLASGGEDKSVKVWDLTQGKMVRSTTVHHKTVLCLQMDDTKIVSGGADGAIHLCDLRKKEPERIAFQHKSTVVRALQFDDSCLVVGTETGAIRVLDLGSGRCMQILVGEHARSVSSVQFDERRIVSGSPDWSVRVWDRVTGQCVEELEEHMRGVFAVRFDRQKLVSGGGDRLVKVWDWDDDLWCINTLRGHTGPVLSVDCDDVRLVSGATDHTVRLWDFSVSRLRAWTAGGWRPRRPRLRGFIRRHHDQRGLCHSVAIYLSVKISG